MYSVKCKKAYLIISFSFSSIYDFNSSAKVYSDKESLKVGYTVVPASATITVTIPQDSGTLTLKDGTYSSHSGNTYTISSHEITSNGKASGYIYLENKSNYSDNIIINAKGDKLNTTKTCFVEINTETNYMPSITSKKATASTSNNSLYSKYDSTRRMLIVGDGETITGTISNADITVGSTITKVQFEPLSTLSDFVKVTEKDTLDSNGKTQSELVTCSVGSSGSTSTTFIISHAFDYGYFATNNGVVDKLYRTKFSLSDITIDESKLEYETVYDEADTNKDGVISENEKTINLEKTEANKQAAILAEKRHLLHNIKNTYVRQNSAPQTSYSFHYYYESSPQPEMTSSGNFIPKTFEVTPIGRIYIEDSEGQQQEILVAVEVRNTPCTESPSYGYEVPSSYYNSITK